jgi:double-stranded uracil-DNA glycosylase
VDRATIDAYDERGAVWVASRRPVRRSDAAAFARQVGQRPVGDDAAVRVDLGCGAGRYLDSLGRPVVGLDASVAMLVACRRSAPGIPLVCGDLESLPFGQGSLRGAWANMSYLHLPRVRLPMALADLHRTLVDDSALDLQVLAGTYEGRALPDDKLGGRLFAAWDPDALADVVTGAGFELRTVQTPEDVVRVTARRARTLADTVGAGMRLLIVGLNPSVRSADAGVPFAPRGNRFWTAALEAGVVTRDRDPRHVLAVDGIGLTDLVKRATPRADVLSPEEYRTGMARIRRMVRWLAPGVVCFVGLSGWRAAVDRKATTGLQPSLLGGRPVYVMPSTSGANAHSGVGDLAAHLAAAAAVPSPPPER